MSLLEARLTPLSALYVCAVFVPRLPTLWSLGEPRARSAVLRMARQSPFSRPALCGARS